jgi:hypothetical protein
MRYYVEWMMRRRMVPNIQSLTHTGIIQALEQHVRCQVLVVVPVSVVLVWYRY